MDLSDERGILVSWLVKLLLGLAIAGVILFEVGAIVVNTFTLSSSANDIAIALATSVQQSGSASPNLTQLETQAKDLAKEAGARLVDVELDTSERVVRVTLRRRADTLVVQRFGAIEDWGRATAEGQSGYQ
ncbi:MAG TPA: hypothetical protein VIG64_15635 [Actinomycetota bacterium]|jgi:hypothetical protein